MEPMTSEPSIWDVPQLRAQTIAGRYDEWRATSQGIAVFDHVRRQALVLRARGWRHYGIKTLWELARYALDIERGPGTYKLNNDFTSRLARELMASEPELAGFFETRELRS